MRAHLLRRVLPFVLTLLVGVASGSLLKHGRRHHDAAHPCYGGYYQGGGDGSTAHASGVRQELSGGSLPLGKTEQRELPEVHLLSPMLMEEVHVFKLSGGGYEGARVTSPQVSQYTGATPKDYKQGVLQVGFYFGADGTISEIEPLAKPYVCSICLQGANVVKIDPRDPQSRAFVEAAEEAVRRIKFEPGTLGGQPVGMHGTVECVFRLDRESGE